MAFEAYKVAVRLSLVSNVAYGLAGVATQFQKLNQHTTAAQRNLNLIERKLLEIRRLGMIGGAMAGAGAFGIGLFKGPLDAAIQYEKAYARFKTLNLGELVNKQADQYARGTQAFGASSTQLMDTMRETYGFFGNMDMAKVVSTKLAELNAANANLFGGKIGGIDSGAARSLMRFADMRGATNTPEEFFSTLNLAQRMVTGSGGAMKFSDLEQLAKVGGTGFKSQSDEGLLMLASIIQEQGGSRTGNALMSLYQNMVAGRASNKALMAIQDLGLGHMVQQKIGTVGGKDQTRNILQFNDENFAKMLQTNTVGAIQQYVLPAIIKKYGDKDGNVSDDVIAKVVNDILSNRRASDLGVTATTQMLQVLRDKKLIENAMGVDQTISASKATAGGSVMEMQAKWNKLLTELGIAVLPIAIRAVEGLTSIIKTATTFAQNNPTLTKGLVSLFGVLAGLVMAGGVVMLATAAFKALGLAMAFNTLGGPAALGTVAGGIATIGRAIVGLAASVMTNPYVLAVLAAGAVGAGIGTGANSLINKGVAAATGKKDNTLGGWLHDKINGEGKTGPITLDEINAERAKTGRPPLNTIRPGGGSDGSGARGDIYMDGRKVGEIVSKHQAREASRPMAGTTKFDGSMTPALATGSGR